MSPIVRTRPLRGIAPSLMAVVLALGCSETAELASALSEGRNDPGAEAQPGGQPASRDPKTGAPAVSPRPPGAMAPAAGAGSCTMRGEGTKVCVSCVDSGGKTVREDCYERGAEPNGSRCAEVKQRDGSTCVVCQDPMGNPITRGCQAPPAGCGPSPLPPPPPLPLTPPPPPPPGGGPFCYEERGAGLHCIVCLDAKGKEVQRACREDVPPASPPPPAGQPGSVTCEETSYPDGTTCAICTDDRGNVVKRGCWSPVPEPPSPPMVTCRDRMENGGRCTVCVDAQGNVVKESCGAPTPPPVPPVPPVPPPPPVPPLPPPPPPPITCHTFNNATNVCVVCFDDQGKIVKQDCRPSR